MVKTHVRTPCTCAFTHTYWCSFVHTFFALKNICRQTSMSFLRLSNSDLYLFKYFFQFLIGVPMRLLGRSLRVTTQQFLLTTTTERNKEFPLWHSGLRIWQCHNYGIGCSCGSDSIPGPGTSISHRCGQKKKKK